VARKSHPVFRALDRWEGKGLLNSELAGTLRRETETELLGEGRRWSQYLLAATGAGVLMIAGGTFLAWAWPGMGFAGRSVTLGVVGAAVLWLGMALPRARRWIPIGYLLQISGSVLLLMAFAYSESAWDDRSAGGVAAGLLALATPAVLVGWAFRRDAVLVALQSALAFLFLFVFLDRTFGLGAEEVLWVLDALLVLGLGFLGYRLRDPAGPEWILNTFLAFLFSGLVLLLFSGNLLWDLDELAILPLDVWLIALAGFTLWSLQEETPLKLQRDWNERLLAYCVLLGIPFAFMTTLEVMETGPAVAALSVAGIGALGFWYSLPKGSRSVLAASCLAFLLAAWYYGAEKAGALGAVLALVTVAGILFFGALRVGTVGSPLSEASEGSNEMGEDGR